MYKLPTEKNDGNTRNGKFNGIVARSVPQIATKLLQQRVAEFSITIESRRIFYKYNPRAGRRNILDDVIDSLHRNTRFLCTGTVALRIEEKVQTLLELAEDRRDIPV